MAHFPTISLTKERAKYDKLADLYSVVTQTEHLEMVWARGSVSDEDYTSECEKLITRFKALKAGMESYYSDLNEFFGEWAPEFHTARNRLQVVGVPATTFHGGSGKKVEDAKASALVVAQTVQYFITSTDGLQLGLKAVDEIHPRLKDIMESLNKNVALPPDHLSRTTVQKWLVTLNGMKAADDLSEEDLRQLMFDLDNAYAEFVKYLQGT